MSRLVNNEQSGGNKFIPANYDKQTQRNQLIKARKDTKQLVDAYFGMFNQEIETVLDLSNRQIYEDLCQFLLDSHNRLMSAAAKVDETSATNLSSFTSLGDSILKEQASQVPTCLILSSSESASSVETQFEQLLKQIRKKLDAFTIVLDERKCGNLKQTIQHIQFKLRISLGISFDEAKKILNLDDEQEEAKGIDGGKKTGKDIIHIQEYQDIEMDVDEEMKRNRESSRYISSLYDMDSYKDELLFSEQEAA